MSKLKSVPESAVERSVEVAGHITVERPEQVGDDPWILVTNDDGVAAHGGVRHKRRCQHGALGDPLGDRWGGADGAHLR